MRKAIVWLAGSGVLVATSLTAQDAGTSTRRTIGAPVVRPSAGALPNNVAPRPASNSPFRPSTAPPVTEAAVGTETSDVGQPPAFGGAMTPTRSRVDTASRFQGGEPAAAAPTLGRGAISDPQHSVTEPADYPRAPTTAPSASSGLSRQPHSASSTIPARPVASRVTTPAEAASPVAEMLLTQALQSRANAELSGQPLPLAQVFERVTSTGQRIKAVQTYWKVVSKVAAYHDAVDDRTLFQSVNVRQMAQHDRAALAAAQQAANAAVRRAELEVVSAQNELIEAALIADANLLPLPSDAPLVSEYRTAFSALYGERAAPSGLRRLDRAMPYHLQDVRAQADALVAAQQAVQATAEAVATGEATVMNLVEATRFQGDERRNFLLSVFDYNAAIAEYALHVAPATGSRESLTSMLIKTRPVAARSAAVVREDGQILPVAAHETIISDVILPASSSASAPADVAPDLQEPPRRFSREQFTPKQPVRYDIQDEVQIPLDQPQATTENDMQQLVPNDGGNYGQE